MASFSSSAFSVDAFSELAFDFGTTPVEETIAGDSYPAWEPQYLKIEREELRKKQAEVIDLKLEVQKDIMLKRELQKIQDKQSQRQLMALEASMMKTQNELLMALNELELLKKQSAALQNEEALLVLSLACPFMNWSVH